MATFQCEEGLIPSGPTTSTCTDTEQSDTPGQWLPNPADTQCAGMVCIDLSVLNETFIHELAVTIFCLVWMECI